MEFWGVEVKAGKPFKVVPQEGKVIHMSQAALGDVKGKGNESILLHVKIDGQKLVLGSLIRETIPQVSFDLVFHKEFELSHDWKNGDVYFCGYTGENPSAEDSESDDESEEQLAPVFVNQNEVKPTEDKSKDTKPKVTFIEPKKPMESSDEDDDDEDMPGALDSNDDDSEDEDDSDDEDNSEDDEETPKPVTDKKRTFESATKTSVQAKKPKAYTPQMTDGKKGGHVATPHPSKQAGNNSAIAQPPKSEGKVTCKSCSRTFNSENALQSHTKAKHSVV